jgi:hypothetical protein
MTSAQEDKAGWRKLFALRLASELERLQKVSA